MTFPPRSRAVVRRPERVRAESMGDAALVAAMREGDPWAWREFYVRFRPGLAAFARRAGASAEEVEASVDEVLADQAERLTAPAATVPAHLGAYLLRATRHRLLNARRAAARRQRHHVAAAESHAGESVVVPLVSEYLRRVSEGPASVWDAERGERPDDRDASAVLLQLALHLRALTTADELMLLTWVAEGVPHRTIAAWLGVRYDAATKRVWRLCRRLRAAALQHADAMPPEARAEVERFLRRAGALPPLVTTPAVPPVSPVPPARSPDRAAAAGAHPADPDPAGRPDRGRTP